MTIARLKITLEDIEPVVSRTIEVPADILLDRLHLVIQAAMGWENYHLYEFMAGRALLGSPDPDFGSDALPATKASLGDIIDAAGSGPIRYIYDFGDDWVDLIEATITGDPTPGNIYPRLCPDPPADARPRMLVASQDTNTSSTPSAIRSIPNTKT